jgi:DNA-binding MarR family transcriptional regulator
MPQTLEDIDLVVNICAHSKGGGAMTVNELVASSVAPRNTVLRRLHALIAKGIVSMKTSLTDKRFRELSLTQKGLGLVRRAANALAQLGAGVRKRA